MIGMVGKPGTSSNCFSYTLENAVSKFMSNPLWMLVVVGTNDVGRCRLRQFQSKQVRFGTIFVLREPISSTFH